MSDIFDEKTKNSIIQCTSEQEIYKEITHSQFFELLSMLNNYLMTQYLTLFNMINCFTKQYAYEPEQEYRFINFDPTHFQRVHQQTKETTENEYHSIQYDPDTGKTYFSLALDSDIIKEIIIGPNCPLSVLDVQTIFKKCKITNIKKSLIHMVQK